MELIRAFHFRSTLEVFDLGYSGQSMAMEDRLLLCVYMYDLFLSFFLAMLSRLSFDHHLRCVGWLNFEFSKREKHSGWAI